ncbi:MAG TPA: hypothetical protein G4O13_03685 [Dehalococcoidia bacterium]|nr:hypothetical protein [Dehalococcoidia bacterium]
MNKSVVILIVFVLLLASGLAGGCGQPDEAYTPTPSPTATPSATPTATPIPTSSELLNITHEISGLSITLTTVSWTGNEVVVEWVIRSNTGKPFDADRLYAIFYPGAYAVDQDGNEGEYFIPPPIIHDIVPGDPRHYETKWLFFPGSELITVRLNDVYLEDHSFVDTSTEFLFSR